MYLFLAVVILLCEFSIAAKVEYAPFEYDRRLMEKLVRLEASNVDFSETVRELETSINSLRQDLNQVTTGINKYVQEVVADSTKKCVQKTEFDDWELVFRATSGNGDNMYAAWSIGQEVTSDKPSDMKRSNNKHYLNLNLVNEWESKGISKVRYSLFENELEVAYVVFNATGKIRDTWFDRSRILETSWTTLTQQKSFNYFSAEGHPQVKRRFFINLSYGGCPLDQGYTCVADTGVATQPICDWDKQATFPQFLYSKLNGPMVWSHMTYGSADYAAVFIK